MYIYMVIWLLFGCYWIVFGCYWMSLVTNGESEYDNMDTKFMNSTWG